MLYKDIKHDLNFYPKLRERRNKNRYIAIKLEKKHKTGLSSEKLTEIVIEALTMDRGWRYVLQHNPRLRGTDYGDKKALEDDKEAKLGYSTGTSTLDL